MSTQRKGIKSANRNQDHTKHTVLKEMQGSRGFFFFLLPLCHYNVLFYKR